jgi:hypothetical protein
MLVLLQSLCGCFVFDFRCPLKCVYVIVFMLLCFFLCTLYFVNVYDFLQQIKEVSLLFSQLRKVNLPLQNLKEFSPLLLLKILLLLILLLFHPNPWRRGSLMLVAPGKHHQLGTIVLCYQLEIHWNYIILIYTNLF